MKYKFGRNKLDKNKQIKKGELHKDNPHKGKYDFDKLVKALPSLEKYVILNPLGEKTIDFSNPEGVKILNKALLKAYYNISFWDIPEGYLCPPIPGRMDYLCYLNDLFDQKKLRVLDIGIGANCIYPLLGSQNFGWDFVGTDIDEVSIKTASLLVASNKNLKGKIELRQQKNKDYIFKGILKEKEKFHLSMCNPPFHSSLEEALEGNLRKRNNLSKDNVKEAKLNFGGQKAELWCQGGELLFLKKMIKESLEFKDNIIWFTSLVSKGDNIKPLEKLLKKIGAKEIKIINMSQGQKISRILAWTFL